MKNKKQEQINKKKKKHGLIKRNYTDTHIPIFISLEFDPHYIKNKLINLHKQTKNKNAHEEFTGI